MSAVNYREKALAFLKANQRNDGAFVGLASVSLDDFSKAHTQPTVFFSALILQSLHGTPGSEDVQKRIANFLLKHKSPTWSWNYWERGVTANDRQQYPDDLDDTACSLGALLQYDRDLVDGSVLGHVAQTLIQCEIKTGGPYNTWIIKTSKQSKWHDEDLAINANVGWFLSQLEIELPSLLEYVDKAIASNNLSSTYYIGEMPLLYFLSRWYGGKRYEQLQKRVKQELTNALKNQTPLAQALLLSAGCSLKLRRSSLTNLAKQLIKTQGKDGSWQAAAFYYEPLEKGTPYYAGSKALTTAFVLEALHNYEQTQNISKPVVKEQAQPRLLSAALRDSEAIDSVLLKKLYRANMQAVIKQDTGEQITGMATLTAKACKQHIPPSTLTHLNLGSLNGWIAYNIYDDIIDDEAHPEMLGVANYALRRLIHHFELALPDHKAFHNYVQSVLTLMDSANTWEVSAARTVLVNQWLHIKSLPDYGKNLDSLWQRSWGHSLAATGVLLASGYNLKSSEQLQMQRFFRHFLIARQLNDDAHDWEEDLGKGHLSSVISLLLNSYTGSKPTQLDLTSTMDSLRIYFWRNTILQINKLIFLHTKNARHALAQCSVIIEPSVYESWLDSLEKASNRAVTEQGSAQKFITTYSGT